MPPLILPLILLVIAVQAVPDERPPSIALQRGLGYLLAMPSTPRLPSSHPPLLVILHGTNSSPEEALKVWAPAGLEAGFLLLCPAPSGEDWSLQEDVPRILSLVHLTLEKYRVNPVRVHLTGFSSGATLACILGLSEPNLFGSMVLASGHFDGISAADSRHEARISIYIVHGRQDEVFPAARARAYAESLKTQGYSVDYLEIPGLGHQYLPHDATRILLRWFLNHPRVPDTYHNRRP
ncbi:MAG: hypothetical protein HYU36_07005 [Planctomycetes bacterium]|nr:hypothetical protein [Planctomycetota bacterium]